MTDNTQDRLHELVPKLRRGAASATETTIVLPPDEAFALATIIDFQPVLKSEMKAVRIAARTYFVGMVVAGVIILALAGLWVAT